MTTNYIGEPLDRVDGRLKVTGKAIYSGDRHPDNLAYGYLLTSTVANGSILAMDTSAAEHAPGVIAIFTPFNPIKLYRPLGPGEGASSGEAFSPLQDTKVLNYGQIIGLVVAESFEQARDASFLVKTRYVSQDPVASWDAGLPNAFTPKDVAGEKANIEFLANNVSSIDDAIHASPVVIDATYTELILHHNPMEPHAVTATWDGGQVDDL